MLPKQKLIWDYIRAGKNGQTTIVGWGGSVGGSKTAGMCLVAWKYLLQYPGCNIMIARDTMLNMRNPGGTMEKFYEFAPCGGELIKDGGVIDTKTVTQLPKCRVRLPHWPPGVYSTAFFRGTDNNSFFKSAEITALFLEEADDIQERAVEYGFSRLRQTLPDGRKPKYLMMAVSNPAISWFKSWFIDTLGERQVRLEGVGRIEFFEALQEDNPFLPEDYGKAIKAVVNEELATQMVGGQFEHFEGQIFPFLSEPTHGIPQTSYFDKKLAKQVMGMDAWASDKVRRISLSKTSKQQIIIPKCKYYIGGLDFGGAQRNAHLTTGGVVGILESGRDILIDTFASNGPGVHDRLVDWMLWMQEQLMKGENIQWCGDKTQTFGLSMLKRAGFWISTNEGKNDSWERGVDYMRRKFALDEKGLPQSMFLITENNRHWLREMQQYRTDPEPNKDGEYKFRQIKANDDRVDMYRYLKELQRKREIYNRERKPIVSKRPSPFDSSNPFAGWDPWIKELYKRRQEEANELQELVSR